MFFFFGKQHSMERGVDLISMPFICTQFFCWPGYLLVLPNCIHEYYFFNIFGVLLACINIKFLELLSHSIDLYFQYLMISSLLSARGCVRGGGGPARRGRPVEEEDPEDPGRQAPRLFGLAGYFKNILSLPFSVSSRWGTKSRGRGDCGYLRRRISVLPTSSLYWPVHPSPPLYAWHTCSIDPSDVFFCHVIKTKVDMA